ncbi:MAG: MFS transporter [Candidatus Omnitrophica bacterium]|nr:MFS transporter [Candidatus Omnitrophota bacterium]
MSHGSPFRGITGPVLTLGFVSFLTDVSSEMIYPLLPIFLTTVLGAGPAALGMIEGAAESMAAIVKLLSGVWSDRVRNRSRLVFLGYSLSSCSRPLVAAATSASHILCIRLTDRAGKGVRTSPRDAMIADAVAPSVRGKAFGFHRSMDHAGAVIGPLLATALLTWWVHDLRVVFWLASLPGLLAVGLIAWKVREPAPERRALATPPALSWAWPSGALRRYLLILFIFTLGNSTDAFLLLRAAGLGVPTAQLPLLWVVFHIVKMVSSMPLGAQSDRFGRRRVILAGWGVYALVYLGFAAATQPWHVWALFALYGVFYGCTEGTERALLADLSTPSMRGAAFGWYHGITGIGLLPASLLFGALWQHAGPQAAFSVGAVLAAVAAAGLMLCLDVSSRLHS